ncbi:MAG: exodeoxyribonuclease VII small subunit [Clostridiales Family XIII bacterium]|jgi:exodeoxyribonuclease VII small subunit|nr:exodeoxyribonuclease VII small subunit [Clostridiales Family XIII bacterium]
MSTNNKSISVPDDIKFEAALKRLETLAAKLEDENVPLDEAIGLYEEGIAYFKRCKEILEDAGRRITIIEEGVEKEL